MISIPFSGSKRNWVKYVNKIVTDHGYSSVYEPFGGSAVLSANLVEDGIIENAIINDYDGLFDIYEEYLDVKDDLVKRCLNAGFAKGSKMLPKEQRALLHEWIAETDPKLHELLANNFAFSCRVTIGITVKDFNYFLKDISTEKQRYYLSVVKRMERVTLDYCEFFDRYAAEMKGQSLIILDPPYLNAKQKQYNNQKFFSLAESIKLLRMTKEAGSDFIFFNMNEGDTDALLNALDFKVEELIVKRVTQNHRSERQDVMAYVKCGECQAKPGGM